MIIRNLLFSVGNVTNIIWDNLNDRNVNETNSFNFIISLVKIFIYLSEFLNLSSNKDDYHYRINIIIYMFDLMCHVKTSKSRMKVLKWTEHIGLYYCLFKFYRFIQL